MASPPNTDRIAVAERMRLRPARDFARLSRGFWSGAGAIGAWLLSVGVSGLVIADLFIQVGINRWNGLFFDALERKDTASVLFGVELILVLALAAAASGLARAGRAPMSSVTVGCPLVSGMNRHSQLG
jgi:putative ATP-binding cassette transporter